jgi:eukaryotic-like serine/threonine-protein kinase
LMDFGIARDQTYDHDLTMTGTGIGTPSYMSPEQILGDRPDARSDIFSLGIVLYQMVTGRKPFIEDEEKSVMHKIRLERHVRARKLNPEIPRELGRIIDKCLQKEPRARFQSGQALVMALERFLAKHVEMNYHSRLVLFLRNQDIITKLEADEYLNPATTGPGAAIAAQHNLSARRVVRRGLAIQGIIVGVVALVVALLHLAPVGATVPPRIVAATPAPVARGYLRVVVRPWGRISIDGQERGMTPLAAPLSVTAGRHRVTVENDYYEPVERQVTVPPGDVGEAVLIDLDLRAEGTRILRFDPDEVKR